MSKPRVIKIKVSRFNITDIKKAEKFVRKSLGWGDFEIVNWEGEEHNFDKSEAIILELSEDEWDIIIEFLTMKKNELTGC